jgi:V8-like Glu-specific endopeptidase
MFTGAAPPTLAQTAGFSPADYGKAQLPLRQSVGDAADFIASNKGAFEPVSELDRQGDMFALARPIGRVDVVLRDKRNNTEVGTACTGALLPGDYVLTNHHCLPVKGDFEPVKASILMDYLTQDGKGAKRFDIAAKPEESDADLDFSIAKVSGEPTKEFGAAHIGVSDVQPNQSLLIVHHPLGRPKVISRFRCLAVKDQEPGPELRHRCDTLGGSSGSLIFDSLAQGVALHKEGGLDAKDAASFNSATRMAALLQKSKILQAVSQSAGPAPARAAAQPPQSQPPVGNTLNTNQMNDILRKP